ncbi:SDR family oxidoreductase [Rhizobium cauense]|uniref:SDR family NAD(P)-dependent oxidoreductase n=1 Tax=Rhizobium cauense TaxID=1166683 RepID=UPI001C6E5D37|nr:SDR family oxidoreductase [Rhizobium cauense]MBW9116910.1 SDR family oxidoreductase [Rhizobium cauense]
MVGQNSDRTVSPQVALITHAASEIGVATVQALARAGADLALATATEPDPHFMESLRSYGGRVVWFPMDQPTTGIQASQLARAVVTAFGRLDVLVANTVHRVEGQIDDEDVDDDALDVQLDMDTRSVIALIKAVSKVMESGGRVVALGSSVADRIGTPGLADFAAARAAIAAFCKGAAHDLGPRGITVNVVQIGAIASRADQSISRETLAAEREANVLKRLGTPSEVAEAIIFLVGPGATFITGSTLNVDGGYSA